MKQNLTTTLKGGMYAFNFDIWLWGSSSNVAGRTIFVVEKKKGFDSKTQRCRAVHKYLEKLSIRNVWVCG